MYPNDSDDSDNSNGVPVAPAPVMHANPTDATVRGFVLPLDNGVPAVGPDASTSAVDIPCFAEGTNDGADDSVPVAADDASTMAGTPLDVGYRFAVLRQVAILACNGNREWQPLRFVDSQPAVTVSVAGGTAHRHVLLTIRRWRDFAAWVRAHALDDFIDLKGTLAGWPDEIRRGARSVLRQLTEACHQKYTPDAAGVVTLKL